LPREAHRDSKYGDKGSSYYNTDGSEGNSGGSEGNSGGSENGINSGLQVAVAWSTHLARWELAGAARLAVLVGAVEVIIDSWRVGELSMQETADSFGIRLHRTYLSSSRARAQHAKTTRGRYWPRCEPRLERSKDTGEAMSHSEGPPDGNPQVSDHLEDGPVCWLHRP
jgi:hypothetical protein